MSFIFTFHEDICKTSYLTFFPARRNLIALYSKLFCSFFPNFDPTNVLSQAGKQRRMKRGLGAKPLLESEIKDAQKKVAIYGAGKAGRQLSLTLKYSLKYDV